MRHKKIPTINFKDDEPFLIDRQLEDMKCAMQKNKNPQLDIPTNAEKTRSQLLIQKKVRRSW